MTQATSDTRKPRRSPPLGEVDTVTRAEQENKRRRGDPYPEDPKYWFLIRLASMLLLCLMPFALPLVVVKNDIEHYVSPDLSAIFAASWTILAVWITLHKGGVEDIHRSVWLLLGLFNLVAALGAFLLASL
jgi:hypothetical protein